MSTCPEPDSLFLEVYEELRALARHQLANDPAGNTLQATALVHEAYVKLLGPGHRKPECEDRLHFSRTAARAMRRILVDRARQKQAEKRGGGMCRTVLDENLGEPCLIDADQVVAVDEALTRFEKQDEAKAELVRLRYFVGYSLEECSALLGRSLASLKRDWAFARAWLVREMERSIE
ncbi:MAG: ECF-type sigma factor [Verrucomicrobiota bacterium]